MKTYLAMCVVALVAVVGCGKKGYVQPEQVELGGVKVDLPKFQAAFANSSPELSTQATSAISHLRYSQYTEALMDLDKLSNNPNLNDAQKKVVASLIDQVKQLAVKGVPPPAK